MTAGALFLDSSALLKLAIDEPESDAIRDVVSDSGVEIAGSELLLTEVRRAAARSGAAGAAEAARLLNLVALLPLTRDILIRAGELEPPELRSLDALHVAAALSIGPRLQSFITYDARQAEGARRAGLDVLTPR